MPTDAMARPTALTLGPNSALSSGRAMNRSPLADRSRTSPLRSSSLRSEISSSDDEVDEESAASSTSSNDSNDSNESEPERRPFALPQRSTTRVRFAPLTPANPSSGMAKSQPLARALMNRALTPNNGQPKKTTKVIVPTKSFRTTFELGLTSSELARKA